MIEEPKVSPEEQIALLQHRFATMQSAIQKAVVGQDEIVRYTLMAVVAGGHVLLEGVPGLGKTLLVKTIASALHLKFQRVQFTPDLMPSDLLGTTLLVDDGRGHHQFRFEAGPIFSNVLLGDEINRATPKTQSALLEAMQEGHVTVGGETRHLPQPFFVLATQNPLEMEGTYPLPEAQMDRFFFQLIVPYPAEEEFARILELTTSGTKEAVTPVLSGQELLEMRAVAASVPATATMRQRAVRLVMATHPESPYATTEVKRYVRYGASPRAGQACIAAAKIAAALAGRFHVASEDLISVAHPILRHRMMLNFEAQADGLTADRILDGVVSECRAAWAREAS
ncbi:MoxR-like ATPase [Terrimicrobium sacchariphilum]|jgi:MoxR-like ATPase|uniref:MoxR-like ATPase n=1 Tax=Terrimicrobium sacchariphilum TaxID=690879 RepID=A0A146G9D5_TERSA|nr:MoxR family ATPase [Terrimicrobium sacchariphilum]GAT33447.1 MoxR-like ATPase [Terrimicrobium sacchariphilum]